MGGTRHVYLSYLADIKMLFPLAYFALQPGTQITFLKI